MHCVENGVDVLLAEIANLQNVRGDETPLLLGLLLLPHLPSECCSNPKSWSQGLMVRGWAMRLTPSVPAKVLVRRPHRRVQEIPYEAARSPQYRGEGLALQQVGPVIGAGHPHPTAAAPGYGAQASGTRPVIAQ